MSGGEVAEVAGSIASLADILQRLGNNYYRASAAWTAFPIQVLLLQAKHEQLQALLERFGQSPLPPVLSALEQAKALMEAEVKVLERKVEREKANHGGNCGIMLCFRRLGEMLFPKQVGLAVQTATQALDSIVKHFRDTRTNEDAFRSATVTRCNSLPFGNDTRSYYVPLELTESKISSALQESAANGPLVVLVYGGPGKGKSTVARHISLNQKSNFSQVLILECGFRANVEARQMQLLQMLGGGDLSPIANIESGTKFTRQSLLRTFLKKQKLLIVLDDVWETGFLQSLLELSGAGVKYLVTSRQEYLCKDLGYDCIKLQIEDLKATDARRMLAVHAGFANQLIPDHFKDMADKILTQAEGFPLVIAQLGAQIGKAESDNLEVWESLADNFDQCLDETPSRYVFGALYPKSWWAAMKQSCDSLRHEAKILLCLLGMCKGPSVPESVLQFLYSTAISAGGCTKYHFSQIKTDLKNRQLVFEKNDKWLSLHSLTMKFIREKMNDTVESIGGRFSEANSGMHQRTFPTRHTENRVATVLICLYLDPDFVQKVDLHIDYSLEIFSEVKRKTVEPIIQLLVPETMFGNSYKETELRSSAIQVLLEFIFNDTLLHDEISELLQRGSWLVPTLEFLEKLYYLGASFWGMNSLANISCRLVCILQEHGDSDLWVQARRTFLQLCLFRDKNSDDVISNDELLHQLVESLCQVQNLHLRSTAASALANLAFQEDKMWGEKARNFSKMVNRSNCSKILDGLVQALSEDQDSGLQHEAARALRNFAYTRDTDILDKMANFSNLLHRLGELLAREHSPGLQEQAAGAVANLAKRDNRGRKEKIVKVPRLVERLVQLASQDQNFSLQKQAARALGNLASTWDITVLDSVLSRAVELLMAEHNHTLQYQAATVLLLLAGRKDRGVTRRIGAFPNLIEKLIHCLHSGDVSLQVRAKDVLNCLLATEEVTILDEMAPFLDLLYSFKESSHTVQREVQPGSAGACRVSVMRQ